MRAVAGDGATRAGCFHIRPGPHDLATLLLGLAMMVSLLSQKTLMWAFHIGVSPSRIPATRGFALEAADTGFYSPAEAARLARVPLRTVYAWRREGIVMPTLRGTEGGWANREGYTFEALIYLRLLRMLRSRRVALHKAVAAIKHLRERFGPPGSGWADARVFVRNQEVFVDYKDQWGTTVASRAGQKVAEVLFDEEFYRLRDRADALLVPSNLQKYVEIDPAVRSGLPVVRGTTLPTNVIYQMHRNGFSIARIREAYPWLSGAQIRGALRFEQYLDATAA